MRAYRPLFQITGAILIASCSAGNDPLNGDQAQVRATASIRTDQQEYLLTRIGDGYRAVIVAEFTNTSPNPLYLARCDSRDRTPFYQFYRSGANQPDVGLGIARSCPGGNAEPLIVSSNTSRVDTLMINTSIARAQQTALPAEMVLRYSVFQEYDASTQELKNPLQQGNESNPFIVAF
ncbi:MAG: hypothetical protein ACT4O1_13530 [Gemmatimonadota bacterium]